MCRPQVMVWIDTSQQMLDDPATFASTDMVAHLEEAARLERRFDVINQLKERINMLKEARFRPMQALLDVAGSTSGTKASGHHARVCLVVLVPAPSDGTHR